MYDKKKREELIPDEKKTDGGIIRVKPHGQGESERERPRGMTGAWTADAWAGEPEEN